MVVLPGSKFSGGVCMCEGGGGDGASPQVRRRFLSSLHF